MTKLMDSKRLLGIEVFKDNELEPKTMRVSPDLYRLIIDTNSGGVRLNDCKRDVVEVDYHSLDGEESCYINDSGMMNYDFLYNLPVGTYLLQDDGLYLRRESDNE